MLISLVLTAYQSMRTPICACVMGSRQLSRQLGPSRAISGHLGPLLLVLALPGSAALTPSPPPGARPGWGAASSSNFRYPDLYATTAAATALGPPNCARGGAGCLNPPRPAQLVAPPAVFESRNPSCADPTAGAGCQRLPTVTSSVATQAMPGAIPAVAYHLKPGSLWHPTTDDELPSNNGFSVKELSGHLSDNPVLRCSDIDSDGDMDLLFAHNQYLHIYFYNEGHFEWAQSIEVGDKDQPGGDGLANWAAIRDFAVGDINGNGHVDLVLAVHDGSGPDQPNRLFINDGNGAFTENTGSALALHTYPSTRVVLADINGDGHLGIWRRTHTCTCACVRHAPPLPLSLPLSLVVSLSRCLSHALPSLSLSLSHGSCYSLSLSLSLSLVVPLFLTRGLFHWCPSHSLSRSPPHAMDLSPSVPPPPHRTHLLSLSLTHCLSLTRSRSHTGCLSHTC